MLSDWTQEWLMLALLLGFLISAPCGAWLVPMLVVPHCLGRASWATLIWEVMNHCGALAHLSPHTVLTLHSLVGDCSAHTKRNEVDAALCSTACHCAAHCPAAWRGNADCRHLFRLAVLDDGGIGEHRKSSCCAGLLTLCAFPYGAAHETVRS